MSLTCEDSWVRSQTLLSSCNEFITHSFADTFRHWRLHWCTPVLWRWKQKISLDSLNSFKISNEFLWEHCETVKTLLMYPWLVVIAGKKSSQSSPGGLQSLRKSWITEEISFWYRNPALFSCPEQLNRWPCPLVGPYLGPSDSTNNQTFRNTTEWP